VGGFSEGLRGTDGIRGRGVSVASRPSTRASKLPVTQFVFVARGIFPRSTPCVCAVRGFLPGRVFPDRTTRRHGLARLPPDWMGLAGRVVTKVTDDRSEGCSVEVAGLRLAVEPKPGTAGGARLPFQLESDHRRPFLGELRSENVYQYEGRSFRGYERQERGDSSPTCRARDGPLFVGTLDPSCSQVSVALYQPRLFVVKEGIRSAGVRLQQ